MSFNKLKISMQADKRKELSASKLERPSAISISTGKTLPAQKSFIPTYRSLSQPPSISTMNDLSSLAADSEPSNNNDKLGDDIKNTLLEHEMLTDISMISEEFKDCLDSVKLDINPQNNEFDINGDNETAADILRKLKTPDEIESPPITNRPVTREKSPKSQIHRPSARSPTARNSAPIRSLSRKNSNSAIPISLSLTSKSTKPPSAPHTPGRIMPKRLGISPVGPPNCALTPSNKRHLSTLGSPTEKLSNASQALKKTMDMFQNKKRRYDTIRMEIQSKQKPLEELYSSLLALRTKLIESGEQVVILDPILRIEFEKKVPVSVEVEVSDGTTSEFLDVDVSILNDVKTIMKDLQKNSVTLCKNMMQKRQDLLSAFENIASVDGQDSRLQHELALHKNENLALNQFLSKNIEEHEKELTGILEKLDNLKVIPNFHQSETIEQVSMMTPPPPAEPREDYYNELQDRLRDIKEYEGKIQIMEKQLSDSQHQLKVAKAQQQAGQENGDALRGENEKLKQKIATLEKLIDSEKRKSAHEINRVKTDELSTKTLKGKVKELENAKAQYEGKIVQLSTDLRTAHGKLKGIEKNFEKELAELNKSRNLDKSVIERLNRDRSTFEARMHEATEQADMLRGECAEKEGKWRQEVEMARQEHDVQMNTINHLRSECEKLSSELNTIHLHAQQSSDLLKRKNDGKASFTERECELQIEVVAQRAAIKALQEKVDSNAMEKIRFIETIENINGGNTESRDDLVRTLVQKEEEITHLNQLLKKRDDDISNRRIEIQNLKAKVDNLQDHIEAIRQDDTQIDLKSMIKEGRSKLEDALTKSLENEHKLIKYEHEMAQKIQTVTQLENTLKLRDGLIGVLKSKKTELVMENKSLNKYAEEIRKSVLEAKEELQEKTEIITHLEMSLNEKIRELHKYKERMIQMEDQLSLTNEKRYRLQDTVSLMERELHMVKSALDAGETSRYDEHSADTAPGRLSSEVVVISEGSEVECECRCDHNLHDVPENEEVRYMPDCAGDCEHYDGDGRLALPELGVQHWQAASAQLYQQYRTAYHQNHHRGVNKKQRSHSVGTITSCHSTVGHPDGDTYYEPQDIHSGHCVIEEKESNVMYPIHYQNVAEQPSCQVVDEEEVEYTEYTLQNNPQHCPNSYDEVWHHHSIHNHHHQHVDSEDNNEYATEPDNNVFGSGHYYQPRTFNVVDSYQVADSGHLVWLTPSNNMQANNAIITRDLFAHSCTKIKNHLEESLRRLSETRASYS